MSSPARLLPFVLALVILVHIVPGRAQEVDRIVAIVNNDVITATEFAHEYNKMSAAIRRSTPPDELEATLAKARKKLLQNMIDDQLIIQKAKELKFNVSPAEVNEALDRVAAQNHMSREQLFSAVAEEGFSKEDYRKFTSDRILRSRLINSQIASRIVIGDERVKDYYDHVYLKKSPPPGYHLLQMGFKWSKDAASASPAEARKRAERIRKMVEEGQDFRELARAFSEAPSAKDDGDLGTMRLREMTAEMRNLLVGLKPGQLSQVARIGDSIQFFQVLSVNSDGRVLLPPFEMVQKEIRDKLYREELDKRLENWMKELREQAIIKKLL